MAITPRQMLVASSKYYAKCPYAMTAEYITIHNTANNASANNEISYMINNTNEVSYHFAVDDKEVVQGIPVNRNAWHAGDGGSGTGNRKSIGIEICYSLSGGDRFIKAEQLAAKFTAQLLKERGWGMDRVRTHQSWSGKYCPHRTLDMGWQRFANMIQAELNELNKPAQPAVTYKAEAHAKLVANKATKLVGLPNLNTVKTYAKGEIIEDITQSCTFNGVKYYRTRYSADRNINNVLPASDFDDYVAPTPKPTWVDVKMDKVVAIRDTSLINIVTGENVKNYKTGDKFDFVQYADWNGKKYYRTAYSKSKNFDRGMLADDFETYKEPVIEVPTPVVPDTTTPAIPTPETPIVTKPTTPSGTTKPTGKKSFITLLIEFISNLFKKK